MEGIPSAAVHEHQARTMSGWVKKKDGEEEAERERIDKLRVEHVLKQAQRIKELEAMLEEKEGDDFPLL